MNQKISKKCQKWPKNSPKYSPWTFTQNSYKLLTQKLAKFSKHYQVHKLHEVHKVHEIIQNLYVLTT